MVVSRISNGIKISVVVSFQEAISDAENDEYWFAYQITIQNLASHAVRLLRRKWFIFDSSNVKKEVEGDGVVGLTPIIDPQQLFTYTSACNLTTDIGQMHGFYIFEDAIGNVFEAEIPVFELIPKSILN